MKPVAIFRHFPIEGPGYLATFLDSHSIPWQLVKVDAGELPPASTDHFSGLVFMGGPMSVNDDLPWVEPALALIQQAVTNDIPVLGHCLGGQLMSKALGGIVRRSAVKEIGWGEVSVADNPVARLWFGELPVFEAFHWHGEEFTVPENATLLLSSPYCENQAFAMDGHLALQCHVEMTEEMVKAWCKTGAAEIAANSGPSVESTEAIQMDLVERVSALNRVARRLYEKWISGLGVT
ncbi:type 1 glutamine amidotransferase [Nitrosovibrio sp. Nv4]|uniref:type 1 glutamine amidotransferase n=1 Tax=Nitrosovibrio sp. Nv4 TaxID=1945880 RepID=UPI000BDD7C9A|nr:type 1 glutamine amidotransferase [Nitrosovibrio sp. Nv4]SOD41206.1 GMP synthase - Glutamine amidotransferase [Nitrosovibrio sp. Nv4]